MRRSRPGAGGAAVAIAAGCGITMGAAADLVGVDPGHPRLSYDNNGVLTYDALTGAISIDATPLSIRFAPDAPPRLVQPTGDPPVRSVSIGAVVDGNGALVGGVPGDDLVIIGQVDADGDGTIDFAGVLLSGEILQFGFQDVPIAEMADPKARGPARAITLGDGMTDLFDFRARATRGALAAFFADSDIGVTVTSEMSTFAGSFLVDFGGEARGAIGPVDPLGACCLVKGRCVELLEEECAASGGTYQGDVTRCADVSCVPSTGACCLPSGACVDVAEEGCFALGGDFQGDFVDCAAISCPQPGACCLSGGSCDEMLASACAAAGGEFQGEGATCTPVMLGDAGTYRLRNHPEGAAAPPMYGLRIDELFDVTAGNDAFTFDFEVSGTDMRLEHDGASTIRIHGTAFGGRDVGGGYDPAWTSLVVIDMTYHGIQGVPGDDDLWVPEGLDNLGTLTWLATGEVFALAESPMGGFSLRLGDEDDDLGHRGVPGISGWGWLMGSGDFADWLFLAEPLCPP